MKPRYVIVNEAERNQFEKEWQMPYGYAQCPIFLDPEEAISFYMRNYTDHERLVFIVERIDEEGREFFFKD